MSAILPVVSAIIPKLDENSWLPINHTCPQVITKCPKAILGHLTSFRVVRDTWYFQIGKWCMIVSTSTRQANLTTQSESESMMYARRGFFATCMDEYCCGVSLLTGLNDWIWLLDYWTAKCGVKGQAEPTCACTLTKYMWFSAFSICNGGVWCHLSQGKISIRTLVWEFSRYVLNTNLFWHPFVGLD